MFLLFSFQDPESHLEDLPEISEELSPSSIRSREKQPEQEPDIGVQRSVISGVNYIVIGSCQFLHSAGFSLVI